MALPRRFEHLLSPAAYPHAVASVELVETHISWILLTGEFAYKIKRLVRLGFIDLTSQEHRAWLCEQEIALNRRFASGVYLQVSRITAEPDGARVDGPGRTIERAVKMRQFDRRDELDSLVLADAVAPVELESFGARLAGIHERMPVAAAQSQWGEPGSVRAAVIRNLEECLTAAVPLGPVPELRELRPMLEQAFDSIMSVMAERRAAGRIRECHGDLHCGNIVRLDSQLVAFDCLEFEPSFRWIDVADEIAFLYADLESFGRRPHAMAFLQGYFARSGDYAACRPLRPYAAHRALVRAKVAAVSLGDRPGREAIVAAQAGFLRYLNCARAMLIRPAPVLILMSGFSGSGKTWLARRLSASQGAIHLRSDVERKRLAAMAELDRSGSALGEGLYSAGMTGRVHERLLDTARSVLQGGFTAIIDATFNRRSERAAFAALAQTLGVAAHVIRCEAPDEILESRILTRAIAGADASEAGVSVLRWQQRQYEPLHDEEGFSVILAHTDSADVLERVEAEMKRRKGGATA
jgi:aminoglycoside phosphotransferase family enzyme/predicted kinase